MPVLPPAPPAATVHHVTPQRTQPAAHAVYTVQPGDSLWSIAVHFYGTGFKWADIFHANSSQISDPNVINVGQQFVIPNANASSPAATSQVAPAAARQTAVSTTAGNLVNPIGPGLTSGRVDMGVDYSGTGPLYAIGDGTITSTYNSGWPGGAFIGLHLSDGRYVYYAEDISPAVQVGDTVKAGQLIGHATGQGIEVGWAASPGTGQTMAAATGQNQAGLNQGDPGYYPTGYGVSFSKLIHSLGGPAGNIGGPVQGAEPAFHTTRHVHSYHATHAAAANSSVPGVPATAAFYIQQAANGTGMPYKVVAAQNQLESSYGTNNGPSVTGAEGPWQFEPYTWGSYSSAPFSQANDWSTSTQAYTSMMKQLLNWSGGNVRQALAAYNAGQGNWQAGLGYADQILSTAGQLPVSAAFPDARVTSGRPPLRRARPDRSGGRGLLHRDGGVAEEGHVNGVGGGDHPAALLQVAGPVHGQDRHQTTGREPARGPGRSGRVAAPDEPLGVAVVPGVLHHAPELLRPEVRHRVVDGVAAEYVGRDHLGGVQRHVPVLEPQPPPEPEREERGAVSYRVDTRQGRAQARVGGHAVLQPNARALQPAGGRPDPDRGDDLIRRDPVAASQRQAARLNRLHGSVHPQPHARVGIPLRRLRSHRGADRGGQRCGSGLHHRDLAAVRDRRGGQFRADPARADDSQPQPGPEQIPQREGVVVAAQEALPAVAGKSYRKRTSGQHQAIKGVPGTSRQQGGGIEPGGGLIRPEVHVQRAEVGAQRRVDAGRDQHLLRQRRPVIWRPRFRPDQGDLAGVAARPQFLRGAQPGQTGACHHDPAAIRPR